MKRRASVSSSTGRYEKKAKYVPQKSLSNPYRKPGLAIEKKNFDVLDVAGTLTSSLFSTFVSLFEPAVGTTPLTRIGRKVTMKSLYIRGNWAPPSGTTDLRVIVYYDKQNNAATPAITDGLTGVTPNFNSHNNLSNSERFIIIVDEIFNQVETATAFSHFQIYRKLNLDSVFNDASLLPNTGGLFIAFSGNCGVNSTVNYSSRVRFTDV